MCKNGRKRNIKIDAKCAFSGSGACLKHVQEKMWKSRATERSKSFQSIVNSSKFAWSSHLKLVSKWDHFWGRFCCRNGHYTTLGGFQKTHQKICRFFIDFEGQIGGQNRVILNHVVAKLDPRKKKQTISLQGPILGRFGVHFRSFFNDFRDPVWMIFVIVLQVMFGCMLEQL